MKKVITYVVASRLSGPYISLMSDQLVVTVSSHQDSLQNRW